MKLYNLKSYTDQELIELIRNDSRGAFTEIYNRYWEKIYAISYNRLKDSVLCEEIVQNIFLSFWKRRHSILLTYSLTTYFAVAVKYQVINFLAKEKNLKKHNEYLIHHLNQHAHSLEDWLNEKELQNQLSKAIDKLPEKCKLVFQLSRETGKSYRQIAEDLNISEKTVEAHISKALKLLRGIFKAIIPIFFNFIIK